MLNNFYKIIHNKYSTFFRFIFFLRYLFVIFAISIALFLILPNFFDYEKKAKIIKSNLAENYNLEVIEYDKIKFKALPIPNLELNNVLLNLKSSSVNLRVKNFKIYPKLFSIYNYNNFQSSKIILIDSTLSLEISDLNFLPNVIFSKSNKILIDNLSLKILNDNKSIIQLDNINFANYGYNKNLIRGKVFEKNLKSRVITILKI